MSDVIATLHTYTALPDASASPPGQAVMVLPPNPKRIRAMFVTDGLVFFAPIQADTFPNGWAINGTAAYGAPPEVTTTQAIYAVRYGASGTLRIWEECRA